MRIEITKGAKGFCRAGSWVLLLLLAVVAAAQSNAAEMAWTFDPPQSQVHWTLDTTLHQVHGTFQLKSGKITFDPATGKASGALIVDATSGESGNESRDKRMHTSIINSQRFTEIVFTPDRVEGRLAPEGSSTLQVHGKFRLMNVDHELTVPVKVDVRSEQIVTSAKFTVPYIQWGLKNPSVMLLHVDDHVNIEIQSIGRAVPALNAAK